MTDPAIGQLWVPESAAVIREDLLTDIKGSMYAEDVTLAVTPGTDTYIEFTAFANAQMVQYAQLANLSTAITPLYSEGADLERWREALGLPVVEASPSTGAIRLTVSGTANVSAGTALVLPNGRRLEVFGSWPSVTDGDEIDVVAIDTGEETNAEGGTVVRFVSAPLNVDTEAEVSYERPLDGGFDGEDEPRKLERILNRMANGANNSGNWGGLRQIAFNSLASVHNCFVYPALGGPAGCKIVPVRGFNRRLHLYTRVFSNAALAIVRNAVHRQASDGNQYVVQAAADRNLVVSLNATLPASRLSGGNGTGWMDAAPWPPLESGAQFIVVSSSSTSEATITFIANITVDPVRGQTHVAWWSPYTMNFVTRLVTDFSEAASVWTVELESPMVDALGNAPSSGLLSPGMENAQSYADSWVSIVEGLGCGENISGSVQAPRDSRRPFVTDGPPSGVTTSELLAFQSRNPEITNLEYSYINEAAPIVPSSIDEPPHCFVPLHFGIYEL